MDGNYENYRPFFDSEWAKSLTDLSEKNPKLDKISLNLILNVKSVIYSACAPFLMAEELSAFHDSFANSPTPSFSTANLARLIAQRLTGDIPELCGQPEVMAKIRKRANEITRSH